MFAPLEPFFVGEGFGVSTLGAMLLAERVGFEPTVTRKATTVFETAPFSHSGTSPNGKIITEKG